MKAKHLIVPVFLATMVLAALLFPLVARWLGLMVFTKEARRQAPASVVSLKYTPDSAYTTDVYQIVIQFDDGSRMIVNDPELFRRLRPGTSFTANVSDVYQCPSDKLEDRCRLVGHRYEGFSE